jgi:predicted ATPase
MNASLQDAIKEAFAIAPTTKVVIHTLEIRQTGVQSPIYISQTKTGINAFDEDNVEHTFIACGFQFTLPPSDEEGFKSLNIAIDNVNRVASDFIETARANKVPVEIVYRPYLSDDLTASQMIPPLVLYLKDVQVTTYQVTGKCTFMDLVNKKFPSLLYQRSRFPSLG